MRSGYAWIVLAALGLLAALAVADALRPAKSTPAAASTPETTTRPKPPTLVETLRNQAVSGSVLYSDQDCILHSLLLPQMTDDVVRGDNGAGAFHLCRFSDAGGRLGPEQAVTSPGGGRYAYCRNGQVVVVDATTGVRLDRFSGCTPAWDADGRLTYVAGGAVRNAEHVLYSRAELRRIARRHPNVADLGRDIPYRVHVLALAWLDRLHMAMSLQVEIEGVEPQNLVVLLDGSRLVALDGLLAAPVRSLAASPTGAYFAEDTGTLLSRQGRSYPLLESVPPARAVAFSPDGDWLAVATGTSVYLVGTPARNLGRVIRLPVSARDITWEPGRVDPGAIERVG